jgi:hypothetical protein
MVAASPLEAAKKTQFGHKLDVEVEEEGCSPAQKTVFSAIFRARKKMFDNQKCCGGNGKGVCGSQTRTFRNGSEVSPSIVDLNAHKAAWKQQKKTREDRRKMYDEIKKIYSERKGVAHSIDRT